MFGRRGEEDFGFLGIGCQFSFPHSLFLFYYLIKKFYSRRRAGFQFISVFSNLPSLIAVKRYGRFNPLPRCALLNLFLILGRPTLSSEVGIIICDIANPASLEEMAKQATVVLNCVGPYRFYGEPVIKACVENGASCIDISGEPQFLELMQWKYHERAAEKGVYIIGSGGFDSIPADLGVIYTRNKMNGTLTAVESFLTIHSGPEGLSIHDGTWKSAVYGFGDQSSLKKLRNASNLKPVPLIGPKLKRRWPISYCRELKSYSIPFMGSDVSVVRRTQRYLYENLEESPVSIYGLFINKEYSLFVTVSLSVQCRIFLFIRQKKEELNNMFHALEIYRIIRVEHFLMPHHLRLTFFGQGYSKGIGTDKNKPNIKIVTQLKGPEAGYVGTSIAMVQAAMTLLNDASDLPKAGGVFTPGAAFSKTKLIDRLNKHGIEFSVISSSEV
nr:saccharopine dehydrogenase-like oxidoreductase [Aotus nancymaae]